MKLYTIYLQAASLFWVFTPAYSQSDEPVHARKDHGFFQSDRIIKGGNVGLWLGTTTFIQASPFVGYRFTDRFSAGLGAECTYIRQRTTGLPEEWAIYGGNLFTRFQVLDALFLQGEYSAISFPDPNGRSWYESPLIGGGYMPGRGMYIMGMWALNPNYPMASPMLRVGFVF
jgi:hypothetical protein